MRIMSRDSYSFYLSFGYNLPCLFLVLLLCFENLPVIFSLHVIFRRSTKDLSHTAHMQDSANKTEGQLNNNSFLTTPSTINSSQTLSELSEKSVTVAATTSPHQLTTLMNSSRRKNTDKEPLNQFFVFGMLIGIVCTISICTCLFRPSRADSATLNLSNNSNNIGDQALNRYASPLEDNEVLPLPSYIEACQIPPNPYLFQTHIGMPPPPPMKELAEILAEVR